MILQLKDIEQLEKHYKIHLFNGITGFKAANLIGTKSVEGNENLAVFSSVVHLGSNPAMIGFVLRPDVVPRNTFKNILDTNFYTINQISTHFYDKAHQTSAKYDDEVSEFEAVGLKSEYIKGFTAPFVVEAKIKYGLSLQEVIPIKSNNTKLIVGKIETVVIDEELVHENGFINLEKANTAAISGLDGYYQPKFMKRLKYASVDEPTIEIDLDHKGN